MQKGKPITIDFPFLQNRVVYQYVIEIYRARATGAALGRTC